MNKARKEKLLDLWDKTVIVLVYVGLGLSLACLILSAIGLRMLG